MVNVGANVADVAATEGDIAAEAGDVASEAGPVAAVTAGETKTPLPPPGRSEDLACRV